MSIKRPLDIWHGDDATFVKDLPRLFPGLPVTKIAAAEDLARLDDHDFALLVSDPERPGAEERYFPRQDALHAIVSLLSLARNRGSLPDEAADKVQQRITISLPEEMLNHPVLSTLLQEMAAGSGAGNAPLDIPDEDVTSPVEILDPGASFHERAGEEAGGEEGGDAPYCETCGCDLDGCGMCAECGCPPEECECAETREEDPSTAPESAESRENAEELEEKQKDDTTRTAKEAAVNTGDAKYASLSGKRALREVCRFFREEKDLDPRIVYGGYDVLQQKTAALGMTGLLPTYTLSPDRARIQIQKRAEMTHGDQREKYEALLGQFEGFPVLKTAALLTHLDEESKISRFWGGLVDKPMDAVTKSIKLSYYMYTDPATNQKVNEDQIINAASDKKALDEIQKYFGPTMKEHFEKTPIDIFKHLPDRDKLVLARIITGNTPPDEEEKRKIVSLHPDNPLDEVFGIRR